MTKNPTRINKKYISHPNSRHFEETFLELSPWLSKSTTEIQDFPSLLSTFNTCHLKFENLLPFRLSLSRLLEDDEKSSRYGLKLRWQVREKQLKAICFFFYFFAQNSHTHHKERLCIVAKSRLFTVVLICKLWISRSRRRRKFSTHRRTRINDWEKNGDEDSECK